MPKHLFTFHPVVIAAVLAHVREAIERVVPDRYSQESPYVAALIHGLEGTVYEGPHGYIKISSTVYTDRGPNSAESLYGADFSITADISDGPRSIRKAILVQAKIGVIAELPGEKKEQLKSQVLKMKQVVDAPKVMQIVDVGDIRTIHMLSGNSFLDGRDCRLMSLETYFIGRILTTLDGCTDESIVAKIQGSKLSQLRVIAAKE